MDIDLSSLPPSTRERVEYQQRENERRARAAEFGKLARADVAKAGDYFEKLTGYDQLDALRALEQDELVAFARASSSRVRNKILEAHPNPGWLRTRLVPDAEVPRLARVMVRGYEDTDDSAYHQAQLASRAGTEHTIIARIAPGSLRQPNRGAFLSTSNGDVSAADAEKLIAVGLGKLVREPKRVTQGYVFIPGVVAEDESPKSRRSDPEPWRYAGATVEGCEVWRVDQVAVLREVDREFDRAIVDGRLIVAEMTVAECRERMPLR